MNNVNNVKGFRKQAQPTKGQVLSENDKLKQALNQLSGQMNFLSNITSQTMQAVRQLGPEVDALTTLEASELVNDAVKVGDHVMMDYLGVLLKADGSQEVDEDGFPRYQQNMAGLKFCLRNVGGGTLVAGFEAAIIGKRAGDTFEVDVTFPKDYPGKTPTDKKDEQGNVVMESMGDKKAKFIVTIHRVYRPFGESPVEAKINTYRVAKTEALMRKAQEAKVAEQNTQQPTEEVAKDEQK
jgi:hypothetical protein